MAPDQSELAKLLSDDEVEVTEEKKEEATAEDKSEEKPKEKKEEALPEDKTEEKPKEKKEEKKEEGKKRPTLLQPRNPALKKKVKTEKEVPSLPKDIKLLPGLEMDEKVDPPRGFEAAYSLKGTLKFVGGRKHDKAKGHIALGCKDSKWMFIVRTDLHFTCVELRHSSTQTDEWLKEL